MYVGFNLFFANCSIIHVSVSDKKVYEWFHNYVLLSESSELSEVDQRVCPEVRPGEDDLLGLFVITICCAAPTIDSIFNM